MVQLENKINIAIVSPSLNAYSETFIRAHIEKLPAKVKVLYGGLFPEYIEDGRPLISRYRRHINRFLHKVFRINLRHFQNQALRRYLKDQKVKAVLAEFGPIGLNIMDACQAEHIPLIVHFHGVDAYDKTALEQYGKEYRRMFEIAKAVVAVSHDMEKQLLNIGIQKEKLHYNPYGIDCTLFSAGKPSKNPPIFLAVGRFVEKKAPHLTILAFQKMHEKFPDAKLVMIGDGPLLDACKQIVHALNLASAVEFMGIRSSDEVSTAMKNARAFVQHSIRAPSGDSEGTPVTVLEAGASGLPVVATRHAGIKDVVIEGKTGLLVDEGDIEGMASQMLLLAKNAELADELGNMAREHISNNYSMDKSIVGLWKIIEKSILNHKIGSKL